MDLKRIHSGKLRAAGYDQRARILRIEFDDGRQLDYSGVGEEVWRRLSTSSSAWSYFRDNIDEEFSSKPAGRAGEKKSNPLDDLFKPAD